MHDFVLKARYALRSVAHGFTVAGCVFLGICVAIIVLNIFMRYVLNSPIQWTEEISLLALAFMVYCTLPEIEAYDDQLALEIVSGRLKPGARRSLNFVRSVLTIICFSYIVYRGILLAQRNFATGATTMVLRIPLGWVYMSMPIVFGMVVLLRIFDPFITMEKKSAPDGENGAGNGGDGK